MNNTSLLARHTMATRLHNSWSVCMQVLFTEFTGLNSPGILRGLYCSSSPQGNSHSLIAAGESAATAQSGLRDAFLASAGALVENSETFPASLWQRRFIPLIGCTPHKRAATPRRLTI